VDDALLVQRLLDSKGQDQTAAEALVRGQMNRIARLCRSMVRNEQAAAELAQEALVRLYTSIPRFRGECKWSTWSHRIARNLCLNWLEKMREQVGDEGLHLVDQGPDAVSIQSIAEREQGVQRSVHAVLDPEEAEAVRLHYSVGLSIAEVTEVMDLQMRTGARGLLQRARRKLKKHMMAHMLEDSIVQRAVPAELTQAMENTLVQLTRGTYRDEPGLEPSVRSMTSAEEDWLS
jgi:RNA polymerase sigma factor (sigma-70 family)